jgi:hypothetical protein
MAIKEEKTVFNIAFFSELNALHITSAFIRVLAVGALVDLICRSRHATTSRTSWRRLDRRSRCTEPIFSDFGNHSALARRACRRRNLRCPSCRCQHLARSDRTPSGARLALPTKWSVRRASALAFINPSGAEARRLDRTVPQPF